MITAGCKSSDAKASAALGEYQSAVAANDLYGARQALLKVVLAKDDVSDYWVELAKVQASLGSYGDAYYALTRAYELDRSNPSLLRALTEMALRSGNLAGALQHVEELSVVAPSDPWIRLTKGWAAIAELRYDEALAQSEGLLAAEPNSPAAKLLKARALLGLKQPDEAIQILTQEVEAQPSDAGSLGLLVRIHSRRGDWSTAADYAGRLAKLTPGDAENRLNHVGALLRSGNFRQARQASLSLLQPQVSSDLISKVLDLWTELWPSPQRLEDARRLAESSSRLDQKLAYASFLSRVGSPADAARLTASYATLPVTAESAQANAVLGEALVRAEKSGPAKARLDAVIAFDPGNATALRARSELSIRTGNTAAAIQDAQKLVTVLPNSTDNRLLLARAYSADHNESGSERTLWIAFQDIPADPRIFAALAARRKGNTDALNDLRSEFERQQEAKVSRGLL
jgi:predicted Zn-dependent protease